MISERLDFKQTALLLFLFASATAVYLLGMIHIDLMDFDATEYACISREMYHTGEYLLVKSHGGNYLDKPPLLFWLSALSFKVFGISHFTYRLPSFLFILLGVFSTYKLATALYDKATGVLSALILYTCQAYFLFSHDVRADCMLTNSVIFSTWQLYEYIKHGKIKNLQFGFLGIAVSMLAKGPIGLVVPALAIGSHLLLKKEFKKIFDPKWLIGLVLVFICLLPMIIGLYQQFGSPGIKFYFWTQSAGRITGESKWKNDTGIFYFVHTFLWSFLPWSILSCFAFVSKIKYLLENKLSGQHEFITSGGFILNFILLSLSRYKLPHYIFIVYPFAAIFTADYIYNTLIKKHDQKAARTWWIVQVCICSLLMAGLLVLLSYVFPEQSIVVWIFFTVFILAGLYFAFISDLIIYRTIIISSLTIIVTNFVLNACFYPGLLRYQSGSVAGKYYSSLPEPKPKLYDVLMWNHSIDFYSGVNVPLLLDLDSVNAALKREKSIWIYTTNIGLSSLQNGGYTIDTVKAFESFRVTSLSLKFLNPGTRKGVVGENYLVKVERSSVKE